MKKIVSLLLYLFATTLIVAQTQSNYDVTAANGNGFRFWNGSNHYKIHMGNSTEYKYGPVTDYSIKMNMSNNPGRGWVWGVIGQTPVAALNTLGDFQIARELYIDKGWLRIRGQKGVYFQDYGGGFRMIDNTWIRTYGGKSFYHDSGIMRTDGDFQVGSGGSRFRVTTGGNVGIGTNNPTSKLHIKEPAGGAALAIERGGKSWNFSIQHTGNNLFLNNSSSPSTPFTFTNNGRMGIGVTSPDSKLAVNGNIHTKEVKVDLVGWSDFVFYKDYKLPTLKEVAKHIKEKGHLKDIPSAKEVAENGILLGEMNAKLLQKIEELTLYTLEQEEKLMSQENKNKNLEDRLKRLEIKILNK